MGGEVLLAESGGALPAGSGRRADEHAKGPENPPAPERRKRGEVGGERGDAARKRLVIHGRLRRHRLAGSDALEDRREWNAEPVFGHREKRRQWGIAEAALDLAHVLAGEAGALRDVLLAEAPF